MILFVRTLDEGQRVIDILARLASRRNGLQIIMMCEVPSNGSNDLTQLTLGLDRDSSVAAHLFDERDPAVKKLLSMASSTARAKGKYTLGSAAWGLQTIPTSPPG